MPNAHIIKKTNDLSDLPVHFLKCRVFGHAWDDYVPAGRRKPTFGWRLSSLCISCSTERHDIIGASGYVVSREYVYPDYYLLSFMLSRADARQAYKQRRGARSAKRGDVIRLVTS